MIHFDENDRQAWLAFLNTAAGAKGIPFLREQKTPAIRKSGEVHEMQFDLGAQEGFKEALDAIESLGRVTNTKKFKSADRPPLKETRRGVET